MCLGCEVVGECFEVELLGFLFVEGDVGCLCVGFVGLWC